MRKIIILLFVSIGLVGGYLFHSAGEAENVPEASQSTEVLAESVEEVVVEPADPVVVRIPSIDVEVDVERVEQDEEGRMDVPTLVDDAAWYGLGAKPGERGNAVIAAHYDTPTGDPSVFYLLNTLDEGKIIEVEDERGDIYTFEVGSVVDYPTDNFPVGDVFGSYETPRLNLITCGGEWNDEADDYMLRTVVYSELVSEI